MKEHKTQKRKTPQRRTRKARINPGRHKFALALTYLLSALFIVITLSSPTRFAYAATDSISQNSFESVTSAVETLAHALTLPPPPIDTPPPTQPRPSIGAGSQQSSSTQLVASLQHATGAALARFSAAAHTTAQSAGKTISRALSQTAAAWSAWVVLANSDLTSHGTVSSAPSTSALVVSQTGANAPPKFAILSPSAFPTPHLFPTAGASSGQSNPNALSRLFKSKEGNAAAAAATPAAGLVLGTSTIPAGYVTQDQLAVAIEQATNALRSLVYQNVSAQNSPIATGGYTNEIAGANKIDQLTGTTLSNVTVNGVSGLTTADIPSLSGSYLPLTGGTVTGITTLATTTVNGALTINGNTNVTQGGDLTVGDKVIAPGEIGLGTTSPYAKLAVQNTLANQTAFAIVGTTSQSNPLVDVLSSAGSDLFTISAAGYVGIGTSSPSDLLSVNGPTYLADITTPTVTTNRLYSNSGSLYWAGTLIGGGAVGNWTLSGGNVYRTSGNVGIGTTSPFATLSVAGSGFFNGTLTGANVTATGTLQALNILATGSSTLQNFTFSNATGTAATTSALAITGISNALLYANGSGAVIATTTLAVTVGGTGSTTLTGLLKGNGTGALLSAIAGIDYATPANIAAAFDFTAGTFGSAAENSTSTIIGFTNGLYALASSTIGNGTQAGGLTISGGATTTGNAYFAGNVGIGTTTPADALSAVTNSSSAIPAEIVNTNANGYAELDFGNNTKNHGIGQIFVPGSNNTNYGGANSLNVLTYGAYPIAFEINGNTTPKMVIASNGNVGIGTTTPIRQLQVGSVGVQSSTNDEFAVGGPNYGFFSLNGTTTNSDVGFALNQGQASGASGNGFSVFGVVGTQTDNGYGLDTTHSGKNSGDTVWQTYYSSNFHPVISNPVGTNNAIFGGNVGIGTSSPYANLALENIYGSTNSTLFSIASSTASNGSTASTLFTISSAGKVSIPISLSGGDQIAALAVGASQQVVSGTAGDLSVDSGSINSLGIAERGRANFNSSNTTGILNIGNGGTASNVLLYVQPTANQTGDLLQVASSSASTMYLNVTSAGLVGIGTTSPFAQLSIATPNGSTGSLSTLFAIGSSTIAGATTTLFSVSNTGAVNITGATGNGNMFTIQDGAGFNGNELSINNSGGTQLFKIQEASMSSNNSSGSTVTQMANSGFLLSSGGNVSFDSQTTLHGTPDIGFSRLSAGILGVGNGTQGTSNGGLVAAAFGIGTTSISNALLSITATSTTGLGSPTTLFSIASTTGGTATSTLFSVSNAGATTIGSTLSVNGAALGGSTFAVTGGIVGSANLYIGSSGILGFGTRGLLESPADSVIELTNNAQTDFSRLQFGGTTASFPALTKPAGIDALAINNADGSLGGGLGIGTSTPWGKFAINLDNGDTNANAFIIASSTSGATTTLFNILNTGNATLAGTLTQNSDERLKTNITPLDASSSLSLIEALNPVSFNWIDGIFGGSGQLGFLAQQVQQVFPQLISTTSPTALTPGGTLGLNYSGLISPIVAAIQALATEVTSLEATVAGFANNFVSAHITVTTGDFTQVNTQTLCVTDGPSDDSPICVTKGQLAALLAGSAAGNQSPSGAQQNPAATSTPSGPATSTPPTITIHGDNPAILHVGDSYADLGATVTDTGTGQAGDTNLGLKFFLNGTLVSNIVIDATTAATDTIQYVAADTYGLTATSTRIVLIEPASVAPAAAGTSTATSPSAASATASSNAATSTGQ